MQRKKHEQELLKRASGPWTPRDSNQVEEGVESIRNQKLFNELEFKNKRSKSF